MSIRQISVFVQSKPGHLKRNLDLFQEAGISVRGFSCSDTGDSVSYTHLTLPTN